MEWYEDGLKRKENTYKDGKLDGLSLQWHANGQKSYEGTFRDGKLIEGSEKSWNSKGESVDSFKSRRSSSGSRSRGTRQMNPSP